jgi:prolyl-tRNA editing enzyme YbaK/EbsC (Cys-tRNA(Pro) deacylase)
MTTPEAVARDPAAHVLATLAALAVPYEVIECDPDLADTALFCERYGVALEESGNCIVVASKKEPKQYAACLVLSHTRLDVNGAVRRLMDVRKASFAPADETAAITGMMIGGVTPFGLPAGLPLYVDHRVFQLDTIVVGGGSRSLKLRVPSDALTHIGAQAIEDLAKPPA